MIPFIHLCNGVCACAAVKKATSAGAHLVVLPECFTCPYSTAVFDQYAEEIPPIGTAPSPAAPSSASSASGGAAHAEAKQQQPAYFTTTYMSQLAQEHRIYLVAGSFPERDGKSLFNTSLVFDPQGKLIAKHRKVRISVP